jgi:hypothetical protein
VRKTPSVGALRVFPGHEVERRESGRPRFASPHEPGSPFGDVRSRPFRPFQGNSQPPARPFSFTFARLNEKSQGNSARLSVRCGARAMHRRPSPWRISSFTAFSLATAWAISQGSKLGEGRINYALTMLSCGAHVRDSRRGMPSAHLINRTGLRRRRQTARTRPPLAARTSVEGSGTALPTIASSPSP